MALKVRGFTLIEMLVALSLVAVLSTLAYQGLRAVLTTEANSQVHQARISALQVALSVLERDLAQIITVAARNEYGEPIAAFRLNRTAQMIELSGVATGFEHSAPLRRIRWQITQAGLYRSLWPGVDGLAESAAHTRHFALPLDIEHSHAQALFNEQGVWRRSQLSQAEDPQPTLFEIVFSVEGLGPVRRLLKVGP